MIEIYQRHTIPTAPPGLEQVRDGEAVGEAHAPKAESTPLYVPVIHVYVFPRVPSADGLRVPGYWTSFRLYEQSESQDASVTK